jgi:asparagine synthase (glutamine-hydrolysing)
MFRYVALIWDSADPPQADAAQSVTRRLQASPSQWHEALNCPGLRVLCADTRPGSFEPHLLARNAGVVLGSVFSRSRTVDETAPAPRCPLTESQTTAIVESRGEWLVTHCWGNYVALIADAHSASKWVVKDPCGSLPCFTTGFRGITIVFSAIADCIELGSLRFTINRRYLERRLYGGDITQQCDALNEVSQIRRGECVEIDPRRQPSLVSRHFCWTPFDFPQANDLIGNADEAARALRNTLRSCSWTLAGCHDSVLLRLSGGLDSSIILGCLKDAPTRPRLLGYTQYVPDNPLDPRRWARVAAQHAGCAHVEVEAASTSIHLDAVLQMAPTAEPINTFMHLATAAHEQDLVARCAASAIFTGDGGDCVFGSFCIGEAVVAYLRRNGLRPAVLGLASQSALALRQTTWQALRRALRMWLTGRSSTSIAALNDDARRLVAHSVVEECSTHPGVHPWLSRFEHEPWEAMSKLGMLLGTPDLYAGQAKPSAAAPEIVAPIYSQPVIELSLRIPADVLFTGGRDRGLARCAFTGDVAQSILDRAWKDRAGNFHEEVIRRNLDWLRQIFLDGVLVDEGLLDRAAVERALSPGMAKSQVFPGEILRHLDTEIWARQWVPRRSGVLRAA